MASHFRTNGTTRLRSADLIGDEPSDLIGAEFFEAAAGGEQAATAFPAGVAAGSAVGSVTFTGAALIQPVGVAATAALGQTVTSGAGQIAATGQGAVSALGLITSTGAGTVSAAGLSVAAAFGSVTITGAAGITPVGVLVHAALGQVVGGPTWAFANWRSAAWAHHAKAGIPTDGALR
jgi:hypothetical protein